MVALTQLVPYGGPGQRYGSFSGKDASTDGPHDPGRITQLRPYGGPGGRYGSFAGKEDSSGTTPTPAGLAHRRRWTVIPWDEDFYRDLVRERRQAKEEIRRLVSKKQKLERETARKSKKVAAGPALIGAQADMLALLGRLEDARARALEAEMAMAAWKAQRDDDDFLDMMVMM